MLVETYEVAELNADNQVENREEALALIESLGLTGQQALTTKKDDSEEVVRMPYRKMTKEEQFIYGQLCPRLTKLADYKDGHIPLRVLQVAAHAKEFFDTMYVHHPENADIDDPVLVGRKHGTSEYSYEQFILARWGNTLESLETLAKLAAAKFRDKYRAELVKVRRELIAHEDIDSIPDSVICGGTCRLPYFMGGIT